MGNETSVQELLQKISKNGAEISVFYGTLMAKPDNKLPPALKFEIAKRTKEIKAFLASRLVSERTAVGVVHKWVLRLGDQKKTEGGSRPAYLACGPEAWCMKMIHQSREFSNPTDRYERARWLILEMDQVGEITTNSRGVMVAEVKLPDGVSLGGPSGSKAEVVSACSSCLTPPVAEDRQGEILKNETD